MPSYALALLLTALAGSATATTSAPQILILGTPHFAQAGQPPPAGQLAAITNALQDFEPDLVAVEFLPPSWPQGKGRDYRRDFDLAHYARAWNISRDQAAAALPRSPRADPQMPPCHLGKLYFLNRDLANALYHWLAADCDVTADEAIASFIRRRGTHEMARIAMPVARSQGLNEVVSFDYQGDDAAWFLDDLKRRVEASGRQDIARQFSPLNRARDAMEKRFADFGADLIAQLHFQNSPEWIDLQRQLYEEDLPTIQYQRAGAHQTSHYWLRNHRMFHNIQAAVSADEPARILVVVGAGHKYFLDELAREAGYDWIDPLAYLPRPGDQTVSASSDTAS